MPVLQPLLGAILSLSTENNNANNYFDLMEALNYFPDMQNRLTASDTVQTNKSWKAWSFSNTLR